MTLKERIEEILIDFKYGSTKRHPELLKMPRSDLADTLKALAQALLESLPEKLPSVPYTHRGFMGLRETSLNEAIENIKRVSRNQTITDIEKILEELKGC